MEGKTITEKLVEIQTRLKAPKGQENKFGGYKYRSCEDILEAVKPLLHEYGLALTISDDIVEVGGRIYVKATAALFCMAPPTETIVGPEGVLTINDLIGREIIRTTALAREADSRKGMDDSQITGSASSYARKYALNGLFAIDDTKDADATNTHGKAKTEAQEAIQALDNMPATEAQLIRIKDTIENIAGLLDYYGAARLEDLTFAQARDAIQKKEKKNGNG